MKKFMEIFSSKPPKTAREFAGLPIRFEEREVTPTEDERIMFDGRPAYAWWNEIQMLRDREPQLREREQRLKELTIVLRIAEWAMQRNIVTDDVLLRIKLLPLAHGDPIAELLNHPEKYVSVVSQESNT